ncbi:MAG TPA: FkbM family methyltransferase, partial [Vicinamibacterales bacterium]|nr:FkbM family methyltransferase [Vicinamibacterales bacterium]
LREHGGFVHYAPDLGSHVAQLAAALSAPPETASIRTFIAGFLRPLGDRPVAPALAQMLVDRAGALSGVRSAEAPARLRAVPVTPPDEPLEDTGPHVSGESARPTLPLGTREGAVRLYATAATRRLTRHGVVTLPPALAAWLAADVAPGDVVYDIGAGVGTCSLAAALQRGAVAVAFEPGFAAFHELCDNVILNGCSGTVVPLPLALAARAGLRALTYPHAAGGDHHALRAREWRPGREAPGEHYTQPVCAETLDDVVRRHRLPPPHALRIALRSGADEVLRGAAELFVSHRPRSVLVMLKDAGQAASVQAAATQLGYEAAPLGASAATLRLVPGSERPRPRPWGALRRAASRVRARS